VALHQNMALAVGKHMMRIEPFCCACFQVVRNGIKGGWAVSAGTRHCLPYLKQQTLGTLAEVGGRKVWCLHLT
jgi:hypothetical protein